MMTGLESRPDVHAPALPASARLVFLGGLHRSGTTMLARMLAEHPDVSGFDDTGVPADEGQHLQDVYPVVSKGAQAGRFALRDEAHLTERSPLVTAANRERLADCWAPHWDTERPWLLEKSPPNLLMTRFLQAMFPGRARFVLVVRHPIAVSGATQKWSSTRPHQLLAHWAAAHRTLRGDLPSLEHVMLVRYERLVADPDAELARVYGFLGIGDHAPGRSVTEGVNSDNFAADRRPYAGVNERYFANWQARKRSPAKRIYLDLCERRYDSEAARFGYSLRHRSEIAPADPLVARLLGEKG
jgi:hypothetical protein